jgi:L-alanine-DL-glutamate epimerase-like enolase superfamily enzyme
MEHEEPTIVRVESWACRVGLGTTLNFGKYKIESRDYVAVRLQSADGRCADCIGLTRGAPLDMVIADLLAPIIVGRDGSDIQALMRTLSESLVALDSDGMLGRARSLIEICLHDLCAQRNDVPLWEYLGGSARAVPVQLIEGYALPGESDSQFADRLAARTEEGYRQLKIEAASYADDCGTLVRRLKQLRERAGSEVAITIDAGWSFTDAESARTAIERWEDFGIEYVEDPLPRNLVAEMAELRSSVSVAISGCDEISRPDDLNQLLAAEALDALRIDATVIGGLQCGTAIAARAHVHSVPISLHEHPEIHSHCALAWSGVDRVEMFPADRPFDAAHRLVRRPAVARVVDGCLAPRAEPGTGLILDIDAVEHHASRHHLITLGP